MPRLFHLKQIDLLVEKKELVKMSHLDGLILFKIFLDFYVMVPNKEKGTNTISAIICHCTFPFYIG